MRYGGAAVGWVGGDELGGGMDWKRRRKREEVWPMSSFTCPVNAGLNGGKALPSTEKLRNTERRLHKKDNWLMCESTERVQPVRRARGMRASRGSVLNILRKDQARYEMRLLQENNLKREQSLDRSSCKI